MRRAFTACLPILLAAAPIAALAVAAGCGRANEPAPGGRGGATRPQVALVMKSLANEFFVAMADEARAHQQAHAGDYELVVNGIGNESDLAQQVALVEQMMARQVDAIVIAPADSRALVPVLARARRQGIVVVNIDNRLDPSTLQAAGLEVPVVGPDNREGARTVGAALAARLPRGARVAILEGIPTAFNAQPRRLTPRQSGRPGRTDRCWSSASTTSPRCISCSRTGAYSRPRISTATRSPPWRCGSRN